MKLINRVAAIHNVAICLLILAFQDVHAENVKVYGIVSEKDTGKPVPIAEVMFISNSADTTRTTTNIDGTYEVFLEVYQTSVDKKPRLENVKLYQNYPNPFNPTTTIEYVIGNDNYVKIDIFNISGQLIRSLINKRKNKGIHRIIWNGYDNAGNRAASGIYVYRLKAGDILLSRKMLMLDGGDNNYASINSSKKEHISPKTAKREQLVFEATIEKEGYENHEESHVIPYNVNELRLDFTLTKKDSGSYVLDTKPKWVRSYRGGGGLFIITMTPGEDFSGRVRLFLCSSPQLHAMLTSDFLSNNKRVSEITIMPDSTVSFGEKEPEGIVEHVVYSIGLIHKHSDKSDTLFLESFIIKDLLGTFDSAKKPPVDWIEKEFPDIAIKKEGEWFHYFAFDGTSALADVYPVPGQGTEIYLNQEWYVTTYSFLSPPFSVYLLLRKRGDIQPLFAAKKDLETSWHEIPLNEFPYSSAFWYQY